MGIAGLAMAIAMTVPGDCTSTVKHSTTMTVTANRLTASDSAILAMKVGLVTAGAMMVHGDFISTVTSSIAMRVTAKTTNAPNLSVKMAIGTKNIVKSMVGRLSKASVATHFLLTKHAKFA